MNARSTEANSTPSSRRSNKRRLVAIALGLSALIGAILGVATGAHAVLFPALVALIISFNLGSSKPTLRGENDFSLAKAETDTDEQWVREGQLFGTGPYEFLGEDIGKD